MELKTPTKHSKKPVVEPFVIDDRQRSVSPKSQEEEEEEAAQDRRRRYVGDVDLPEGQWSRSPTV